MHNFISKARNKIAAVATTASVALASAPAFAGEYAEAVKGGVDTAEILAIGIVVLTVTGIILFIRSGKKAAT